MGKPQDKHDAQDYPTGRIGDKTGQERQRGGNEQHADYEEYRIHRARIPSAMTTRQCRRDQDKASRRARMPVRIMALKPIRHVAAPGALGTGLR